MIGIIDYGSGNVQAIATIYKNLNITFKLTCGWQYKNATTSFMTERKKLYELV